MKAGARELEKGDFLFHEGDASDAAYVIKSGKIAITKAKGANEIVLAEVGPGSMIGEMAFFDSKPRSAGARAMTKTVAIALPFVALHAQFKTFPEWLKVMIKTINKHVRDANQRIKNLETVEKDDGMMFDQYTVTRLLAILTLVANKFGEETENGVVVPGNPLRNYCIQIFQQPTNKMQKLTEVLESLGHLKNEALGEGRSQVVITNLDLLSKCVDFYNDWLFKEESKRVAIDEKDLPIIKALLFYANKAVEHGTEADKDGNVQISLTLMQNESMKDLGELVKADQVDGLIEKGLATEKIMGEGAIYSSINPEKLGNYHKYWDIIYKLLNAKK